MSSKWEVFRHIWEDQREDQCAGKPSEQRDGSGIVRGRTQGTMKAVLRTWGCILNKIVTRYQGLIKRVIGSNKDSSKIF